MSKEGPPAPCRAQKRISQQPKISAGHSAQCTRSDVVLAHSDQVHRQQQSPGVFAVGKAG